MLRRDGEVFRFGTAMGNLKKKRPPRGLKAKLVAKILAYRNLVRLVLGIVLVSEPGQDGKRRVGVERRRAGGSVGSNRARGVRERVERQRELLRHRLADIDDAGGYLLDGFALGFEHHLARLLVVAVEQGEALVDAAHYRLERDDAGLSDLGENFRPEPDQAAGNAADMDNGVEAVECRQFETLGKRDALGWVGRDVEALLVARQARNLDGSREFNRGCAVHVMPPSGRAAIRRAAARRPAPRRAPRPGGADRRRRPPPVTATAWRCRTNCAAALGQAARRPADRAHRRGRGRKRISPFPSLDGRRRDRSLPSRADCGRNRRT